MVKHFVHLFLNGEIKLTPYGALLNYSNPNLNLNSDLVQTNSSLLNSALY